MFFSYITGGEKNNVKTRNMKTKEKNTSLGRKHRLEDVSPSLALLFDMNKGIMLRQQPFVAAA